jgi:glycosyltransferase involved in cell wall biosynthesis
MVKEADALANAGYLVTVLYVYWNKWGTEFDKELIASKKWEAICIGGDPQYKRITYFISRAIYKLTKTLTRNAKTVLAADITAARAGYFLTKAAKKQVADLYIAHNIGALPAVVAAAKLNKKPCGFDAEDFHRYEVHDDDNHEDVMLKSAIENKYIPQLNYFTTSSPQIANAYKKLFKGLKPTVLLNVFPKGGLNIKVNEPNENQPIKLFWFSQTIGPNRGINDVIDALHLINALNLANKDLFELHLLGDILPTTDGFINEITKNSIKIEFHKPLPPDDIISFASQFDIGLALENKRPLNRDICLTNKIFVYMQAGLAIIASDTTAQKDFIDLNNNIGQVYKKEAPETLAALLLTYYKDRQLLNASKKASLRLAHKQYNWETESVKFLALVEKTLSDNIS